MAYYRAPEQRAKRNAAAQRARRERHLAMGLALAPRRWWTTTRAAVELGLSQNRVYQLIDAGQLVAVRAANHCGTWRIDPASVAARLAA